MEYNWESIGNCSRFVKTQGLEARAYQINIINSIIENGNTLVVLPTGLGKTLIAVFSIACALENGKKAIIMAPTKPLSEQHYKSLTSLLNIDQKDILLLTGKLNSKKRSLLESDAKVITATPQTIANDLRSGNFKLEDFGVVVFDECHRAVGKYAYTYIADECRLKGIKIIGLTASPGSNTEKVLQLVQTLNIESIEVKTQEDEDIKPYIKDRNTNPIYVNKSDTINRISLLIKPIMDEHLYALYHSGLCPIKNSEDLSKMKLLEVGQKINDIKTNSYKFNAIFHYIYVLDLMHAYDLVTTEGLQPFLSYLDSLKDKEKKNRSLESILKNEFILKAEKIAKDAVRDGEEHPKAIKIIELIKKKKIKNRIIIFAQYRSTINMLVNLLNLNGLSARAFVGRKEGVTQDQQMQVINDFRLGKFDILVATSIGEEGLDIPNVDTVIFYEPITSAIRNIQRKGRTGRFNVGNVYILITKGTKDETYMLVSDIKEKRMYNVIKRVKSMLHKNIKTKIIKKGGQQKLI